MGYPSESEPQTIPDILVEKARAEITAVRKYNPSLRRAGINPDQMINVMKYAEEDIRADYAAHLLTDPLKALEAILVQSASSTNEEEIAERMAKGIENQRVSWYEKLSKETEFKDGKDKDALVKAILRGDYGQSVEERRYRDNPAVVEYYYLFYMIVPFEKIPPSLHRSILERLGVLKTGQTIKDLRRLPNINDLDLHREGFYDKTGEGRYKREIAACVPSCISGVDITTDLNGRGTLNAGLNLEAFKSSMYPFFNF